jgi:hypothetical protein
MPASSINRLCVSGCRTAAMAQATTTAKNKMPLHGTMAKAIPSSICPIAADRFIALTPTRKPKIVIAVASDMPIMPTERCRITRPEAASQLWNTKNSDHAKKMIPWAWITGVAESDPLASGMK